MENIKQQNIIVISKVKFHNLLFHLKGKNVAEQQALFKLILTSYQTSSTKTVVYTEEWHSREFPYSTSSLCLTDLLLLKLLIVRVLSNKRLNPDQHSYCMTTENLGRGLHPFHTPTPQSLMSISA